jgi:hypothetical protein
VWGMYNIKTSALANAKHSLSFSLHEMLTCGQICVLALTVCTFYMLCQQRIVDTSHVFGLCSSISFSASRPFASSVLRGLTQPHNVCRCRGGAAVSLVLS